MDLGGQQGELSAPVNRNPTGSGAPSRWMLLYHPSGRKAGFFLTLATAQPMRDGHSPANEKPPYVDFLVYLKRLSVCNRSPNSPLPSSMKDLLLLCSVDLPQLTYRRCHPLLFLDKSTFASEIPDSSLFKVKRFFSRWHR